ncbi:MAG: alternative ribosome rescue aminoacyl-tRNA hydrolase ArfB [Spirochaetia bacterium]|jgi:ribosome-associated protein|nr:alternative ribosome rescue aminoacyl-tRNA hydrolase ArfB [Spirochaetales bacterium]MDX9784471.1 alternative ribosome rescue aminoacyl-tRNA hydrolase ArfB [Spirochaetia bacterium]
MNKEQLFDSLKSIVVMDFSRSSGPGGQNVNKLNTKVTARLDLKSVEGLSEAERRRVAEKLINRLDAEGFLSIQVQDERSQWANRTRALERLFDLITSAAKRTPPRIPTKPGKAAKERRLATKKAHGAAKRERNKPFPD